MATVAPIAALESSKILAAAPAQDPSVVRAWADAALDAG
ncbi:MAG: hypothetical protein RLZZ432_18, partial [Chloroflexota bacterium]